MQPEVNYSFQLKCFLVIATASTIALTALIIAIALPETAIIAGAVAATSTLTGLAAFGLYANGKLDDDSASPTTSLSTSPEPSK